MDLATYVDTIRRQLTLAAETGGHEAQALAERLSASLESAARLVLLEALSAAADEITREMAPGTVEVRLRGSDPEFVVTPPPDEDSYQQATESPTMASVTPTGAADAEGGTSRLNLRLPEALKLRIEQAAHREGLSLNVWLIRAAAAALETEGHYGRSQRRSLGGGERYTGWVR